VIDDEIAQDRGEYFGGAEDDPAPVDVQGVVLDDQLGHVELIADEEVEDDADDGNRAQGFEAEEVEGGDGVVVLRALVLLVLLLDLADALEGKPVRFFSSVYPRDSFEGAKGFLRFAVDD
jgi:hypothetical protein